MEINFGAKKVWNDLFECKDELKYFVIFTLLLVICGVLDVIIKTNFLSPIAGMFFGGYLILMINNIINERKPILENLATSKDEKRNLFLIIVKQLGIGITYGVSILFIGVLIFLVIKNLFIPDIKPALITTAILLIPFFILTSMANLMFAQNLNFKEAFDIKKAIDSIKIGWKKYLSVFVIYIALNILAIFIITLTTFPLLFVILLFLKAVPAVVLTKELSELVGGIIGSVFGQIIATFLAYWYMNAVAQIYKYTISKMSPAAVE